MSDSEILNDLEKIKFSLRTKIVEEGGVSCVDPKFFYNILVVRDLTTYIDRSKDVSISKEYLVEDSFETIIDTLLLTLEWAREWDWLIFLYIPRDTLEFERDIKREKVVQKEKEEISVVMSSILQN